MAEVDQCHQWYMYIILYFLLLLLYYLSEPVADGSFWLSYNWEKFSPGKAEVVM